jgi:hypothetical protein
MTVSSIAAEVIFSAGWIAVGAAAAYSRYKKAMELGERARGIGPTGATREYHNGLYCGRAVLTEGIAPGPEWKAPEKPELRGLDAQAMAPASLARLAQALEDAELTTADANRPVGIGHARHLPSPPPTRL